MFQRHPGAAFLCGRSFHRRLKELAGEEARERCKQYDEDHGEPEYPVGSSEGRLQVSDPGSHRAAAVGRAQGKGQSQHVEPGDSPLLVAGVREYPDKAALTAPWDRALV